MEDVKAKKMGWEVAREVEAEKPTIGERAIISKEQIKTILWYAGAFLVLFLGAVWLAGNPFEFTQRLPSAFVKAKGWVGTDNWTIVWWVVRMCAFFEYMDSAGGMGYGNRKKEPRAEHVLASVDDGTEVENDSHSIR